MKQKDNEFKIADKIFPKLLIYKIQIQGSTHSNNLKGESPEIANIINKQTCPQLKREGNGQSIQLILPNINQKMKRKTNSKVN